MLYEITTEITDRAPDDPTDVMNFEMRSYVDAPIVGSEDGTLPIGLRRYVENWVTHTVRRPVDMVMVVPILPRRIDHDGNELVPPEAPPLVGRYWPRRGDWEHGAS